jgi:hypothetical protein
MRKLILVVGLTVANLQGLGTIPKQAGESVQRKSAAPIGVGASRRTQPAFLWDRLPTPHTRRDPRLGVLPPPAL